MKRPLTFASAGVAPAALDKLVVEFMVAQQVPNAQLAVSVKGKTTFSHAYTYRAIAVRRNL